MYTFLAHERACIDLHDCYTVDISIHPSTQAPISIHPPNTILQTSADMFTQLFGIAPAQALVCSHSFFLCNRGGRRASNDRGGDPGCGDDSELVIDF